MIKRKKGNENQSKKAKLRPRKHIKQIPNELEFQKSKRNRYV